MITAWRGTAGRAGGALTTLLLVAQLTSAAPTKPATSSVAAATAAPVAQRPTTRPAARETDPWSHALAGRDAEASAGFAERLAQNPKDISSAIGLAALLETQDDPGAAAAVLARALASGADGADAAGAVAALTWLAPRSPDGGAAVIPFLTDIVERRVAVADPEVRTLALLVLADAMARKGDAERAIDLVRQHAGGAVHWALLGPYGRFEALDLLRALPPEAGELTPSASGAATDGVRPARLDTTSREGRVAFPNQFQGGGVVYAATDLLLDAPATLRISVGSLSSFALFIDGQSALLADRVRSNPAVRLATRAELSAGRHRLLVKLTNGGRPPSFQIFVEGGAGAPAPVKNAPPDGAATGSAKVTPWVCRLDDGLAVADAARPAAVLSASWWLRARGLDEKSGALLRQARERWADTPLFDFAVGEWFLAARTGQAAEEDLTQSRTLLTEALGGDERMDRARLLVAGMDENAGQFDEAWQAADAVLARTPAAPDALALQHRVAARRGWTIEAARRIEQARAAAPGRNDLLVMAIDFARRSGPSRALADLLAERRRRDPLDDGWAEYLSAAGRLDEARAEWERLKSLRPNELSSYLGLHRVLLDAGRTTEALAALDEAERLFPQAGVTHLRRAATLARSGDDRAAEATAELRLALDLDPERIDLWDTLARRGVKDPLADWLANAREIISSAGPPAPGSDSALLADIAAVVIDSHGGQTELYQGVHGVYTRAGVEREGELETSPGAQIQGIRIHKASGRTAEVLAGEKRPVSLPGLEPGDTIEYIWRRYIPAYSRLTGAVDNRSLFLFQGPDREYVLSRYVVIHDADLPVEACGTTRGLETIDEVRGEQRVRAWTARQMPRLASEPHTADPLEVIPNIRLSLGLSWQDVGDVIKSALAGMLHPDPPLPALADEVRRRAEGGAPEAVARALHTVVREHMRPGDSALSLGAPASVAASAGEGNRAVVALALAQMVGLDARLVLARPVEDKGRNLDCPFPQTFTYPLVEVRLPGRTVFLDYTDADHPFDAAPARLNNADALEIPLALDDRAQIIELPRRDLGLLEETSADLTLGADGRVDGTFRLTARGSLSAVLRRMLRETPADSRLNIHRQLVNSAFPGAEVVSARATGENDLDSDFVLEIQLRSGAWARRTPTGFALPVAHHPLGLLGEYGALPSRNQAMLLDVQEFRRDRIRVALPPGLTLTTPPPQVSVDQKFGAYRLQVQAQPGAIEIVREASVPPARVETADYPAFRDFARTIDDVESRELVLAIESPSLR